MKKVLIKFLAITLILIGFNAYADDSEALKNILNTYQSMSADFSQVNYDPNGEKIQTSKGVMALVKPGKFYWYTKSPTEQKIVATDDKVWIYDIDLEQATLKKIDNSSDSAPALLLSGSVDKLKEKYTISYVTSGSLKNWYRLLPKNKDNDFQEIDMHFTNNTLDKMNIKDNLSQTTKLTFSNIKINETVSPKLFTLTFPKDVDVIQ